MATSSSWGKVFTKVFLFGDSITQESFSPGGWGASVADHFQRKVDVFNRGFAGYNTEWAKLILPTLLPSKEQADFATVFFGANDAALPDVSHLHVPLPTFKANLNDLCSYLKSIGLSESAIVLITPPPLCEELWEPSCKEMGKPMNRSNAVTKQYAEAVLQVGQETNIATIDLYGAMSKEPNLKKYFSDGLHLNADGNQFIADLLIPFLESKLSDKLSVFPHYDDVDPECPAKSFQQI